MHASLALLGLGGPEVVILLLVLGGIPFWLWMIVDCISRETETGNKIAWLLVILFANILGAPLYFLARKLPRDGRRAPPPAYSR
mgnify:CR=1 FL=1